MITHGGRLPAETSRFFGRSQEAAAIRDSLSRSRLVTLTGPGGVGKTRLALRVAAELAPAFPDGVRLVPLSAVRDAGGLTHAVTAALGMPAGTGASCSFADQAGQVASGLSGRRVLLILDTCEHLIDACAAFADAVLSGADGPVILVTSRQPLGLPGEVVFRIPPLGLTGEASDAVALFADRAGAALPGFVLTEEARPKVAWLCRALDGIPLEIELAALRLRAVGLDELLARLPGRLRLLAGGRRADDRQQTVQASITWSYDLCTAAERLLWNRLSVFSGGFDLTAAEAVCGGGDLAVVDVLETLIGLVDKSVVLRADIADFAGGDARYRLLEVVREQGAAHVDAADIATCAVRHRDHYLAAARRFAASFVGPDQVRLVSRLAQDAANLRLALGWSLAAGQRDPRQLALGTELAVACLPWWACTGQLAEASLWFTRFLADSQDHHPERSRGFTQPASAARDGAEPPALARRLARWLLAVQGDEPVTGTPMTEAPAAGAPTVGQSPLADLAAAPAGAFESLTRGAFDECAARCAALTAALPEGESWVRGWAEWVTGLACWLGGDVAAADRWLRDGLGHLAPFDDDLAVAQHLEAFAWLAAGRGEHRRTAWLHGAADLRWRWLTESGSVRVPRFGVALLHAARDRAERTARDALGPVGYAAEHGAGAALTERDALRCALGELSAQPARGQQEPPSQPDQGQPDQGRPALTLVAEHAGRWQLLTSREREVAVLVAQGMTNKDVAARLFVSKRTIDAHIEHILAKLSYASRVQIAALVAYERGLAEEEGTPGSPGSACQLRIPVPRTPQERVSAPPGTADTEAD